MSNYIRGDMALRKQELALQKEIAEKMEESEKQFSMVSNLTRNMNQGFALIQQMMQQNSCPSFHQTGVYNWKQQQLQERQQQHIGGNSNSLLFYEEL